MQPQSQTSICNLALGHLGIPSIADIEQTESTEARLCRSFYPLSRDSLLREHEWNFAIKRAVLSQLVTGPTYGYDYAYQLPDDCLRVLAVNNTQPSDPSRRFAIEGETVVTNEETAQAAYLFRQEDTTRFDPIFIEALSYKLASMLAGPLTQDEAMKREMERNYALTVAKAKYIDGNEGRKMLPFRTRLSTLVAQRRSRRAYHWYYGDPYYWN